MPEPSLAAEERAFRKGRGRMVAAMSLAVLAALTSLGLFVWTGDEDRYVTFGKNVNRLDGEHFAAFWGCAFPGYDLRRIRNDRELRNQIHLRAEEGTRRYAQHLRTQCLVTLGELEPRLEVLIAPDDVRPFLAELIDAVARLRKGATDYVAELDAMKEGYDREASAASIEQIARAWYDYRTTHARLNAHLRTKIQP